METAEVVIVGGGVIGCSIAYHLAERGAKGVLLLERAVLGSGATGACAGGIRQQFSTEVNIRLSQESLEAFKTFPERMGVEIAFRQVGYLFLLTSPEELEAFQKHVVLQQSLGVPVSLFSPDEAKRLVPQLNVEDVVGATFCPADGHADPYGVLQGYARRARLLGVRIQEGREVQWIEVEKGRVKGVITREGRIAAPVVINAAGPHAARVAASAGIELPLLPHRRSVFVTEPFDQLPDPLPMIIDFTTGFYFHRESGGILMGMANRSEPPSFHTGVEWDFLPAVLSRAVHRAPVLETARIKRGWAGLYEMTPDAHPILGEVSGLQGFLLAVGFSGHGFMHAPAVGKLLAELILDGKASTLDISPLSLDRFREGKLLPEYTVI